MHKLITRGLPAALAAAALLLTGAGTAFAGTPDNGGKSLGHANTPNGKAKGQAPAPTPTPDPTPTYQRSGSAWIFAAWLRGDVSTQCDAGDVAVENGVVMITSPGFHVETGPTPFTLWSGELKIDAVSMTYAPDDGVAAAHPGETGTGTITITCADVTA